MIETSLRDREQCGITFPCCTYGPEYQYNVKEMLRHGKTGIYRHYDDFYEMEQKRLTLHSRCPTDVP